MPEFRHFFVLLSSPVMKIYILPTSPSDWTGDVLALIGRWWVKLAVAPAVGHIRCLTLREETAGEKRPSRLYVGIRVIVRGSRPYRLTVYYPGTHD